MKAQHHRYPWKILHDKTNFEHIIVKWNSSSTPDYTIYISCLQQEYLNICLFQYLNLNSYDWMNFDLKEVHRYCTRYTVGTFFMSVKYVIIQVHNVKKSDRKITFLFSVGFSF